MANAGQVLATVLKTPDEEVDDYLRALAEMAVTSGGGTDPPQTVGDCRTGTTTGSWIWRRRWARS